MAPLALEIQPRQKRFLVIRGQVHPRIHRRRAHEPRVKRPRAARNREVPRRAFERRDQRDPRRQLVGVVPNQKRARSEVTRGHGRARRRGGVLGLDVQRRVERVHVERGARVCGVVCPGGARAEVDAVPAIALGDEYMRQEAVAASARSMEG